MDVSPFPHHGPLAPHQLTGRDDLVADLHTRLAAHRVTALLGPRRFGKTSVLRRVAADLADASVSVVAIDLYEVTSQVDLALRLDAALDNSHGRVADMARRLAAGVELRLGAVKVSFARPARPDPVAVLHNLLDILVDAAAATPTVVMFDEFSSIGRVDGAAGLFRTRLQHHYDRIGLLFAGSAPSTMRALFSEREQPFYGQADLVTIDTLDALAVHDLVVDGFERTGRDPGRLPGLIHQHCAGHPRRTMQLADCAWEMTAPSQEWRDERWADIADEVAARTDDANEALFSSFNDSEKKVLRILASGGALHGTAAELVALNPTPARRALANLIDGGIVADRRIVDPLLAHWLTRRLPL